MKNILSLLKALSDQNRLRVVTAFLSIHELSVCQIKELLKKIGAIVSRHLALLLHTGLVDSRKEHRCDSYRLVLSAEMFQPIAGDPLKSP